MKLRRWGVIIRKIHGKNPKPLYTEQNHYLPWRLLHSTLPPQPPFSLNLQFHTHNHHERRPKLRFMSSVLLQRRQPSPSRMRKLRRYLQHRHRLTGFISGRSHRHRHLRRGCSRIKDSFLLLDLFPRRNRSLLEFLPSRMYPNNRPSPPYFLHGTRPFSIQFTFSISLLYLFIFLS